MDIELDVNVTSAIYESLDQIVDTANPELITDDHMSELFKRIAAQLAALMEKRAERGTEQAEDEEDLEQMHETEEEEDMLLEQVRGVLGYAARGSCCCLPQLHRLCRLVACLMPKCI